MKLELRGLMCRDMLLTVGHTFALPTLPSTTTLMAHLVLPVQDRNSTIQCRPLQLYMGPDQ